MKVIRGVLAVVFLWSVAKSLELLLRAGSVDRLVFEGSGLPWLFWAILVPLAILQAGGVWFVVQVSSGIAYRMAQAAVILGAIETVVASALTFGNPELLKNAIITSRTERGLPVRPEVLRLAESPAAQVIPIVIAVALGCLWLFLLWKLAPKHISQLEGRRNNAMEPTQPAPPQR